MALGSDQEKLVSEENCYPNKGGLDEKKNQEEQILYRSR